ncbi:MAG: FadR family transcriptional regulator [Ruminococcaceae bacterium]|nr:FadR family transcriptional regulator [Oscillospiraceae bacterium]
MQTFKRQSLTKQLMDVILANIESGELPSGEKLPPEAELAEKLQVSRNTLREALKTLETFGIIESIHGQGTFVSAKAKLQIPNIGILQTLSSSDDIQSLLDARLVIEPGLAKLAAERHSDDDIDAITESIDRFVNNSHNLETNFHMQIAAAAHSPMLYGYLHAVYQKLVHTPYPLIQERLLPDQHDDEVREHKEILYAILEHDGSSARELMYLHLNRRFKLM